MKRLKGAWACDVSKESGMKAKAVCKRGGQVLRAWAKQRALKSTRLPPSSTCEQSTKLYDRKRGFNCSW